MEEEEPEREVREVLEVKGQRYWYQESCEEWLSGRWLISSMMWCPPDHNFRWEFWKKKFIWYHRLEKRQSILNLACWWLFQRWKVSNLVPFYVNRCSFTVFIKPLFIVFRFLFKPWYSSKGHNMYASQKVQTTQRSKNCKGLNLPESWRSRVSLRSVSDLAKARADLHSSTAWRKKELSACEASTRENCQAEENWKGLNWG